MNWGLLVLRLAVGTLLMFHAVPALVAGPETWQGIGQMTSHLGVTQFFIQIGLAIVLIEVIGAALLIMGILGRVAAALILLTQLLILTVQLMAGHGISGSSTAILLSAILLCLSIAGLGQFRLFLR